MRSRLEDLIATAERQVAARSYDAAMDTFRTALLEPGAAEAGIEEKLDAARRTRDEARGVVQPAPVPPPPAPADTEVALPLAQAVVEPEPAPPPVEERPFAPPSFHLIEDDPSALERPKHESYESQFEKLSILNPKAPPDDPDPLSGARILVAVLIFVVVCAAAFLLK